MATMTQQEMDAYLTTPHVAHLVTTRPSGRPHVAPVWFMREGGHVLVIAQSGAVKLRNIQHNPVVALSVATDQPPYQYVIFEGEARITTEDVAETVYRVSTLYKGTPEGAAYAQDLLAESPMVVLDIRVDRVISWRDG